MNTRIPTQLSVNLNKVALLRNQRDVGYPSVLEAARLVVEAGAHGLTVHPRPDERHIRRSDVHELRALIDAELPPHVEFNIEGNPTEDFLALVETVRPDQVTLVPDSPDQRTSDHGWPFDTTRAFLLPIVARLKAAGLRVALFVDANAASIEGAAATGADRVELYTEPFAAAFAGGEYSGELENFAQAGRLAREAGLGVNAGHDLTIENTRVLRQALPMLAEVSIGHALTADALTMGFAAAVAAYLDAIR